MPDPLVSAVMVALPVPERLALFRRSVASYLRQTHARTELVIVLESPPADTDAIRAHIATLGRPDIRPIAAPHGLPLGALRNLGLRATAGDIFCQWDDDDISHPERIAHQLATLVTSGRHACLLQDVMQYLEPTRELFWANWAQTPFGMHPGTLMCDRHAGIAYPEHGEAARTADDAAVLTGLLHRRQAFPLAGAPHLHVYVTHRHNTLPNTHHRMLAERLGLSRGLLLRRENFLRQALAPFDWDGPVTVTGPNGPAFTLGDPP